jgi:hypothetical protein
MHIWHIFTTPGATYSKSMLTEQSFCLMQLGGECGHSRQAKIIRTRFGRVERMSFE